MNKGIDISHWNKIINFEKVSQAVDFVILKAGGSDKGFYQDKTFLTNYKHLHDKYSVPTGAYYYVGRKCTSFDAGVNDALKFIKIIQGLKFEYPLYIDLESTSPKDKEGATEACIGFCRVMEQHGYYVGIYASDISGFKERLNIDMLRSYDLWVARYGSKPKYAQPYGIHQYSSTGTINGIAGKVDLDESYKNYPAIMKVYRLNGY